MRTDFTRQRLLSTPMFELDAVGGAVECRLHNRPGISREDGARYAQQMSELLLERVFVEEGTFRGLLFDVRQGPPVFGPQTRTALAGLFGRAETTGRAIAVLVGDAAIQSLQFKSLAGQFAPSVAVVVEAPDEAWRWVLERRR